ncbi:Uncharacterized protein Fot_09621 [Forsythia ovata]|uniref:Uncharacterized protein n=1 Tax=Forsythia ovata TaxID=205694 RepID=A0ABD1WEW9_9LAMI
MHRSEKVSFIQRSIISQPHNDRAQKGVSCHQHKWNTKSMQKSNVVRRQTDCFSLFTTAIWFPWDVAHFLPYVKKSRTTVDFCTCLCLKWDLIGWTAHKLQVD